MKKAFIFDMDGVIIDSEPIHSKAKLATLASVGISFPEEKLVHFMGRSSKEFFSTMLENNPQVKATWKDLTDKKHAMYLDMVQNDPSIHAINGLPELLERLKNSGYKIGLASSSSRQMIDMVLDRFGIRHYFSCILSGAELPKSKPDPAIYLMAAEALGLGPESCTVVEDANAGVEAAKRAGMYCIAYRNPNSGKQDLSKADRIINAYTEINI